MKKFKFRAWDEGNKIMHNNFQFIKSGDNGNDWIIFISDKQTLDWDELRIENKIHPFNNPFFQQQLNIMQYIGINDVNDKEVYEGDIIKHDNPNFGYGDPNESEDLFTTINSIEDLYENEYLHLTIESGEVVGNIYENGKEI